MTYHQRTHSRFTARDLAEAPALRRQKFTYAAIGQLLGFNGQTIWLYLTGRRVVTAPAPPPRKAAPAPIQPPAPPPIAAQPAINISRITASLIARGIRPSEARYYAAVECERRGIQRSSHPGRQVVA